MKMQEILRKELDGLYQKLGRDGLPESISMETGLDIQSETFFLKEEKALFDDQVRGPAHTATEQYFIKQN